jgi:hypothetical protein
MSHADMTVPVTRTRPFWTVVAYAVLLGLLGGLIAVVFIGAIEWAVESIWSEPAGVGLFEGEPWWILLIAAFGLLIGLIRKALKVQPMIPGLFDEISERRRHDPGTILVSALAGARGASLLERSRMWFVANAGVVVFGVSLLFGVLFTGQALISIVS